MVGSAIEVENFAIFIVRALVGSLYSIIIKVSRIKTSD